MLGAPGRAAIVNNAALWLFQCSVGSEVWPTEPTEPLFMTFWIRLDSIKVYTKRFVSLCATRESSNYVLCNISAELSFWSHRTFQVIGPTIKQLRCHHCFRKEQNLKGSPARRVHLFVYPHGIQMTRFWERSEFETADDEGEASSWSPQIVFCLNSVDWLQGIDTHV